MPLAIDTRFERVVFGTLSALLLPRKFQQVGHQFYQQTGRVGKLITVDRVFDPSSYLPVAVFTIRVRISSEDLWAMNHFDLDHPTFPFPATYPYAISRPLGKFFGKQRGDEWLALDLLQPEGNMVGYLRDLFITSILPYLDGINTLDDILNQDKRPSLWRMRTLALLGRQDEAYTEFRQLLDSRHQRPFRTRVIELAQQFGLV